MAEEMLLLEDDLAYPKIVTFISSGEHLGITCIMDELADAIATMEKQVTLVNVASAKTKAKNPAMAVVELTGGAVPGTGAGYGENEQSVCDVMPPDIRILHIDAGGPAAGIELLREIGNTADFLLVDIPFEPTPFAGAVLAESDLIIIVSSCKLDEIYETKNVVKTLLFLDISPEKTAALLVDPEGMLSSASLEGIRPFLEANLGVEMVGVISFDVKAHGLSYPEASSLAQYRPGSQLSQDFMQLARFIMTRGCQISAPVLAR